MIYPNLNRIVLIPDSAGIVQHLFQQERELRWLTSQRSKSTFDQFSELKEVFPVGWCTKSSEETKVMRKPSGRWLGRGGVLHLENVFLCLSQSTAMLCSTPGQAVGWGTTEDVHG